MKKVYFVFVAFLLQTTVLFCAELIPLPFDVEVDDKKVQLGKKLFLDTILSKDKTLSCMSCHNLKHNGADTVSYSKGIKNQKGKFNVPTVFNAVYNFRQFWDGRAKSLKEQALEPIQNPVEMGHSIPNAIRDLKNASAYVKAFNTIYEDGITENNLADALTEFEKTLITPNAPFDKYLRGDKNAISKSAVQGYKLFKDKGCISCHNGINIGGNLFNKFGIYGDIGSKEKGRYALTKKEEDMYVFKVPSLRNVAITAPYMHDGRTESLAEAVNFMVMYQLGRRIGDEDLRDIVSFLESLTGDLPKIVKDINVTN